MPEWFWPVIFTVLGVGGIFVLAVIGLGLLRTVRAIISESQTLVASVQELAAMATSRQEYSPKPDALNDNPADYLMQLRSMKKAKEARRQARERRLIARFSSRKQGTP